MILLILVRYIMLQYVGTDTIVGRYYISYLYNINKYKFKKKITCMHT